jgi:hypothetical protein
MAANGGDGKGSGDASAPRFVSPAAANSANVIVPGSPADTTQVCMFCAALIHQLCCVFLVIVYRDVKSLRFRGTPDFGLRSPSKGGLRTPDSGTPAHFNYFSLDHVNQP